MLTRLRKSLRARREERRFRAAIRHLDAAGLRDIGLEPRATRADPFAHLLRGGGG